jgi:hypothetical protein
MAQRAGLGADLGQRLGQGGRVVRSTKRGPGHKVAGRDPRQAEAVNLRREAAGNGGFGQGDLRRKLGDGRILKDRRRSKGQTGRLGPCGIGNSKQGIPAQGKKVIVNADHLAL